MFPDPDCRLQTGLKWNFCKLKKERRWVRGKPFIVSTACRQPSDKTSLLSALPKRDWSRHKAQVGARPPRRNHWLRQPVNEDGSASLSLCTLAGLSFAGSGVWLCPLFVANVSILPSLLNKLSWFSLGPRSSSPASDFALTIYPETPRIFVYLPTSH